MALTTKQEKFAVGVVTCKNNSDAYRSAYDCSRMTNASINRKATELIQNVKVAARIEELRRDLGQRNAVNLDTLLRELEEARGVALGAETPQSAAAVSATMGKAKLLGLDKQLVEHSGTVSVRNVLDDFYGDA